MSTFKYISAWGNALGGEDRRDLIDFWLAEGALTDPQQADQRASQAVLMARDDAGRVAGVGTAVPCNMPQIGQPLYYYRSFIGQQWRSSRLVYYLVKRSRTLLEDYARDRNWPCIGVLLELENTRFSKKGRMPVWPHLDFVYVGRSPRDLELRVSWFRQAPLR